MLQFLFYLLFYNSLFKGILVMHPIILFFEDHRDPLAKQVLSQHLPDMAALEITTLALEVDKGITIEKHLEELRNFCSIWSVMSNLPPDSKKAMLDSLPPERQAEFQHHLSYLPARKAELALVLNVKNTNITVQGIDLILDNIRASMPQQQMRAAHAMQTQREAAMVNNLAELNTENGVMAILGLSHYEVANKLKQQGHEVFCFLPVSVALDGVCSQFLNRIARHDATINDLVLLDGRTQSMDQLWQIIESSIQARCSVVARMG